MIRDPVARESRGSRVFQWEESSPPPASSTRVGECPGVTWNASRCPSLAIMCRPAEGVASGAAGSPHAATAPTTTTGRTMASAARRNRDILRVVMAMTLHGFPLSLAPADHPTGTGVTPTPSSPRTVPARRPTRRAGPATPRRLPRDLRGKFVLRDAGRGHRGRGGRYPPDGRLSRAGVRPGQPVPGQQTVKLKPLPASWTKAVEMNPTWLLAWLRTRFQLPPHGVVVFGM